MRNQFGEMSKKMLKFFQTQSIMMRFENHENMMNSNEKIKL